MAVNVEQKAKDFNKIYYALKFKKKSDDDTHNKENKLLLNDCVSLLDTEFGKGVPKGMMPKPRPKPAPKPITKPTTTKPVSYADSIQKQMPMPKKKNSIKKPEPPKRTEPTISEIKKEKEDFKAKEDAKLKEDSELNFSIDEIIKANGRDSTSTNTNRRNDGIKSSLKKHPPREKKDNKNVKLSGNSSAANFSNISNITVPSKKKMKYTDFLNRSEQYEILRQGKLDQMRNESTDKSFLLQDKPTLSPNTLEMAKKLKRRPIYERAPFKSPGQLENGLREFLKKEMPQMDEKKEKRMKKRSNSTSNLNDSAFYEKNIQWMKLREKKEKDLSVKCHKSSDETSSVYSIPRISHNSQVLARVKEYEDTVLYKNRPSRHDLFYQHYSRLSGNINETRSEDFRPQLRRNNSFAGASLKKEKTDRKKVDFYKPTKTSKSVDEKKGDISIDQINQSNSIQNNPLKERKITKEKRESTVVLWMDKLRDPQFNVKDKIQNDNLYKLNVRPTSAWNHNASNSIILKNHDMAIVNDFL